jgi:hypothetical protein
MSEKMHNLRKIRFDCCSCCNETVPFDSGEEFEFISTKKERSEKFICDSCLETIINSDKAEEYY